jgi:hypothetical protein
MRFDVYSAGICLFGISFDLLFSLGIAFWICFSWLLKRSLDAWMDGGIEARWLGQWHGMRLGRRVWNWTVGKVALIMILEDTLGAKCHDLIMR